MRVLLFRGKCDTGGVLSWMLTHARELLRRGVQCEFQFCLGSNRLSEFEALAPTIVAPIEALVDAAASGRFDVIHISSSDAMAEILAALPGTARIVATNHGIPNPVWQHTNCHARTAVSRGMADIEQHLTDVWVEPIPNGVDCAHFCPPAALDTRVGSGPIVAWSGRTTDIKQKDFPRWLRIATLLAERGVRLWVADSHDSNWEPFEKLGLVRPPVERWERYTLDHMPEFYQSVAASGGMLLMTSPFEGFGLAAVEAAACGATVAAPDTIGLQEAVIPGATGLLYPRDASDADVADRIMAWLAAWNPERAATASRTIRERFSSGSMTERYVAAYGRPAVAHFTGAAAFNPQDPLATAVMKSFSDRRGQRLRMLTESALRLARLRRRRDALRVLAYVNRAMPGPWRVPAVRKRIARTLLAVANPFVSAPEEPPVSA